MVLGRTAVASGKDGFGAQTRLSKKSPIAHCRELLDLSPGTLQELVKPPQDLILQKLLAKVSTGYRRALAG